MVCLADLSSPPVGAISPWLQGLFGGTGAMVLWNVVLEPGRQRRSLAKGIGAEVFLNLRQVALASALLRKQQRVIPADLRLSLLTFTAVAPVIGYLDASLVTDLTGLYAEFAAVNRLVDAWAAASKEYRQLAGEDVGARHRHEAHTKNLLVVYQHELGSAFQRANETLPRVRRAARYWFMRWKQGSVMDESEIDKTADTMIARARTSGGTQPHPPRNELT
jgi:hypothetical protein